jgi:hypothetical protein
MRKSLGYLTVASLAVGLISCTDVVSGTSPNGARRAFLAVAPEFEAGASQTSAALANGGLTFDHVRVLVVRPATDTLADSTIAYLPTDTAQTMVLAVLAIPNDSLVVTMQYKSGTTVLFEGSAATKAIATSAASNETNTLTIPVTYIGPGATAKTISIAPATTAIPSGATTSFSAKAFDAGGVEQSNAPFVWAVNDTNVATINATSGVLTPKVVRGEITVTADLPSAHASRSYQIVPQATGLLVVKGAAQVAPPGSILPLPVIVQLVASDGLPGLGVGLTASFSANGGGSITPASVAFDANGRAQATVTLGANAGGVYLYTVTAGTFSLVFPEIAVVGPPTQLIPSGSTSITMTAGVAPSPIPTFRVADALGNSVPLVQLKATIRLGADSSVTPTFVADTIGISDVSKIAEKITIAGSYTVTFASGNTNVTFPTLTYNITVNPAAAAKLAFGGLPTSVKNNTVVSPAVTVLVQDQYGNTVTSSSAGILIGVDPSTGPGVTASGNTATAVNGVATFSSFKLTSTAALPQSGVQLKATSTPLASPFSAVTITP